jgi:hypothetical protein
LSGLKILLGGANPRYKALGLNNECVSSKKGEISGCGYDKLSTATASALNHDSDLIRICFKKWDDIKSLYGVSRFEVRGKEKIVFNGGVGIQSHINILEALGFEVKHLYTKLSDILIYEAKK